MKTLQARVYVAQTGLENADGARVEAGDILPADFVPHWQIEYWLAQGDVTDETAGAAVTEGDIA